MSMNSQKIMTRGTMGRGGQVRKASWERRKVRDDDDAIRAVPPLSLCLLSLIFPCGEIKASAAGDI